MTKKFWQSKTILIACLQAIVGILTAILVEAPELRGISLIIVLKSFLDISLRFVTESKID